MIQYPEEKTPVYPRFRGRHKLHRFEDTGLEKCVGCSLCAAACPAKCIRVVAAENTPEQPGLGRRALRGGLRDQHVALHLLRLLRGGLPVRRDHDGQRLRARRLQPLRPDLHQGDAAGRPARAHAAAARRASRTRRHVVRAGPVLHRRRSARWRARSASCCCATRSTRCSRWSRTCSRWPCCSCCCTPSSSPRRQVVVYAGAVMVLYLFVVAYIGGVGRAAAPRGRRCVNAFGPLFAAALGVELCIAFIASGLEALDTARRRRRPPASARPARSASCC